MHFPKTRSGSDQPTSGEYQRLQNVKNSQVLGKVLSMERVFEWYIFPLHLILAIIFAMTTLFCLDGKTFRTDDGDEIDLVRHSRQHGELYQSDITTLISVGLVLVRWATASCAVLAAQRCMFILLEQHGMTFTSINRLFSFGIAPFGRKMYQICYGVVVILLLPAQWSAPLASGAVSWIPHRTFRPADFSITMPVPGLSRESDWFNKYKLNRDTIKQRAQGNAVLYGFPASFYNSSLDYPASSRRRVDLPANSTEKGHELQALPEGTKIRNATLPYFRITNITWIDYEDRFDQFFNESRSLGSFTNVDPKSQPLNILARFIPSETAILDWDLRVQIGDLDTWPEPAIINKTYTMGLLVNRRENEPKIGNCSSESYTYGKLPDKKQRRDGIWNTVADHVAENCYMFANITVLAGVTECRKCSLAPGGIMQQKQDFHSTEVRPDPLVDLAFRIQPEIMFALTDMNAMNGRTWDNLDGHVAGSWSAAFQASWNALNDYFEVNQAETTIELPVTSVQARVSSTRIYAWIAMQLLLSVSGALLALLQSRCEGKTVGCFVSTCLLTDPTEVYKDPAADKQCQLEEDYSEIPAVGILYGSKGSSNSGYRVLQRRSLQVRNSAGTEYTGEESTASHVSQRKRSGSGEEFEMSPYSGERNQPSSQTQML